MGDCIDLVGDEMNAIRAMPLQDFNTAIEFITSGLYSHQTIKNIT